MHNEYIKRMVNAFFFWHEFTLHARSFGQKHSLDPGAMVPDDPLICVEKHSQGLLKLSVPYTSDGAYLLRISVQDPSDHISASLPPTREIPESYCDDAFV